MKVPYFLACFQGSATQEPKDMQSQKTRQGKDHAENKTTQGKARIQKKYKYKRQDKMIRQKTRQDKMMTHESTQDVRRPRLKKRILGHDHATDKTRQQTRQAKTGRQKTGQKMRGKKTLVGKKTLGNLSSSQNIMD